MHLCRSSPSTLLHSCLNVYFDLPLLTSNTHTFFRKHTHTHTRRSSALLTTFPSLAKPFIDAHKPSSAGVGLPLPQTSTHFVCITACACSQTDLASSVGARHTAHNIHWRVPCSSFQLLFSFLPSLLFLWFSTSIYGICYMRRQQPKPLFVEI